MREEMKNIIDPEIIFCIEHILFLYPKDSLHKRSNHGDIDRHFKVEIDDSNSSSNDSSEDDLFDVKNSHF